MTLNQKGNAARRKREHNESCGTDQVSSLFTCQTRHDRIAIFSLEDARLSTCPRGWHFR